MTIPRIIQNTINEINESEDKWKVYYAAVWQWSVELTKKYKNNNFWDNSIEILCYLPASKRAPISLPPEKLHDVLTHLDHEIVIKHLNNIFSLVEKLVNDVCDLIYPGKSLDFSKYENLVKFLKSQGGFNEIDFKLTDHQYLELKLAKETRNCFIHGRKANSRWVSAYWASRKKEPEYKDGDEMILRVPDVEDWQDIITKVTNEIQSHLLRVSHE